MLAEHLYAREPIFCLITGQGWASERRRYPMQRLLLLAQIFLSHIKNSDAGHRMWTNRSIFTFGVRVFVRSREPYWTLSNRMYAILSKAKKPWRKNAIASKEQEYSISWIQIIGDTRTNHSHQAWWRHQMKAFYTLLAVCEIWYFLWSAPE